MIQYGQGGAITQENAIEFVSLKEKQKQKAVILLFLHKAIKDIRNSANHMADENRYEQTATKNAFVYYISLFESLIK